MSLFNYECDEVKRIIQAVSPNYPQLTTYEREWIYFYKNEYIPGIPVELEYEPVIINPTGSVSNAIPFKYKSAILKGNTKYCDIDTGEFLEAFEEGRNLELVSVQMPVLTTTGKNLFNGELENGAIVSSTGVNTPSTDNIRSVGYIKVKPNTSIVLSNDLNYSNNIIYEYDSNKDFIGRKETNPFTTSTNCQYIRFRSNSNQSNLDVKYQIEYGTKPTTYEPYKSNILSTSEDVELREVGEVRDELNLLTGEVVERIGEVSFKSSSGWVSIQGSFNNVYEFKYALSRKGINHKCISNNIIQGKNGDYERFNIYNSNNGDTTYLFLCINKSRLSSNTLESLNDYLISNPLTVQYQLANESIKTVDLTPLNKPYEGVNHYHLTSNIPCESILEVPVVSTGEQTLQEINNY